MWSSNLWLEALWMVSCLLLLCWLISDLSKILICFFLLTLFKSSKFAKSLHKSTSKRNSLLWRYFRVFINIFQNKTNQCYLLAVPIQYISFFLPWKEHVCTIILMKRPFDLGRAEDYTLRNFSWPAWRLNIGICVRRKVWVMSLGCLCNCHRGSNVPAVLSGWTGATEPHADPHEGINNIKVIVTDFYDVSKWFPSYPMHLLLYKFFKVTTGKK